MQVMVLLEGRGSRGEAEVFNKSAKAINIKRVNNRIRGWLESGEKKIAFEIDPRRKYQIIIKNDERKPV